MRKLIMATSRNSQGNNANQLPTIKFVSKKDNELVRLKDCFRIMSWKQFKNDYRGDLRGLELYAIFEEQWQKHEIHTKSYDELVTLCEELGYEPGYLLKRRNRYYELRDQARAAAEANEQPQQYQPQQPYYQPVYQQPVYQPVQQMQPQRNVDQFNEDESDAPPF
jgi:hypothetical protein